MKFFLNIFLLACFNAGMSQEQKPLFTNLPFVQLEYSYGALVTQRGTEHLTSGNPTSFFFSYNVRTSGQKRWHQKFNYPDIGYSGITVDLKNKALGKLYGAFGHFNFYIFNRKNRQNLILSTGAGAAYITKPYHKITNNKNILIGSHINVSTYLKLFYFRENILGKFGFQAGFSALHASNGSFKAPNKGINIWSLNVGLNYNLTTNAQELKVFSPLINHKQPVRFNLAIYGGFNEVDHINVGSYPFLILSTFIDKHLNTKSTLQLGTELHFHYSLKEANKFYYLFNGENTNEHNNDWKRASLFIGYELTMGKLALFTQLGYYIYDQSTQNNTFYERVGLKRALNKNLSLSLSVKAHLVNAEGLELGLRYRFKKK